MTTASPSTPSNPSPSPLPPGPSLTGGCPCKTIRYRMIGKPLVVHCCHCRWCQLESGSAFAVNAMIEANRIVHLGPTEPELSDRPSESGSGQCIAKCPNCHVVVWSNYDGPLIRNVRVGTLDTPAVCPPDVHIFTKSKMPWVVLPEGVRALERNYERRGEVWSRESMERWWVLEEKVKRWEEKKAREEEEGSTGL